MSWRETRGVLLVAVLIGVATPWLAGAVDKETESSVATHTILLEEGVPAANFPRLIMVFGSEVVERLPGTTTNILCEAQVKYLGVGVSGVPVTVGGELFTQNDVLIREQGPRTRSTNVAGYAKFTFPYQLPPPGEEIILGAFETAASGGRIADSMRLECGLVQRQPCRRGQSQACLLGNRFKVEVFWRMGSSSGMGRVISSRANEASFSLTTPGTVELIVQLAQRCAVNDHYWVAYGFATFATFEILVTDMVTGADVNLAKPSGETSAAYFDPSALPTCP